MAGFAYRAYVAAYDSNKSNYKYLDVVRKTKFDNPAVTMIYICLQDNPPINIIPNNAYESNGYWQALNLPTVDISNYWKPTYAASFSYKPVTNRTQFREGALGIETFGINNNPVEVGVAWDNVTLKEANGLIAFFEMYGGTHPFSFTMPEPINLTKKFLATSWKVVFSNFNLYSVRATLEENYDIFSNSSDASGTADFQFYLG